MHAHLQEEVRHHLGVGRRLLRRRLLERLVGCDALEQLRAVLRSCIHERCVNGAYEGCPWCMHGAFGTRSMRGRAKHGEVVPMTHVRPCRGRQWSVEEGGWVGGAGREARREPTLVTMAIELPEPPASPHRSILSVTTPPSLVVIVKPTREKSVNSSPPGPVSVRQREKSVSGSTLAIVSVVTPQYVASNASSWIAMFLSMPAHSRARRWSRHGRGQCQIRLWLRAGRPRAGWWLGGQGRACGSAAHPRRCARSTRAAPPRCTRCCARRS